ncbi:MAG: transcriptional regulator GcvA [Rhodospirillales bacterium]|jgi:LysR family transcriptional regulator, glycine cleavage system transcriptional activator|nr:transcriptional regulator GcvA [Rhodospirillales bacterium]
MTERLPSLNSLRAFEAVARHQSFSKAAEELHVTQAAVSQQVKTLEADLGSPLFYRANRQVFPTEIAQSGLPDLRVSFDRMARAMSKMRATTRRQVLTIRVEPTFAATWLVARLEDFREASNDVDILVDASLRIPDFERDNIDVAIHFGTGDYPGMNFRELFKDDVFPVCSPELIKGTNPLCEPNDLKNHTLIHLESIPGYNEWPYWNAWLRAMGVEGVDINRGPRFTDHFMSLKAAREGQGVAMATMAIVADDIADGRLVLPFDLHMKTAYGYYLVWPKGETNKPHSATFRDWICAEIDDYALT